MFPGIDPSKLDPQLIAEISDLMRTMPPAKLMRMQSIMQKAMGGGDITAEMAEFERDLPADFRAGLARIMYKANGVQLDPVSPSSAPVIDVSEGAAVGSVREARLTLLVAVRDGKLTPEAALGLLFPDGTED